MVPIKHDTARAEPSRRVFLQRLGQAGGAVAVYQGLLALGLIGLPAAYAGPPELPAESGRGLSVVILGAGIAGLVSAYELRKAGYRVTVLEARGRPGGRVFTVRNGSVIDEVDSQQKVVWERGEDMFFDAGAARLPQHHQGILGYARELDVPIEVLSNHNRNGLLQTAGAFQGQAQRSSRVNADARGFVAELAAKAVDQASLARLLTLEDKEKLRTFLRAFGALDEQLKYKGSARNGYREPPGAGDMVGAPHEPLDVNQLFQAGFWSQIFQLEEHATQMPTMLRPVGGMAKIAEALARSLGKAIRYHVEVTELRRSGAGARVAFRTSDGKRSAVEADYVIATIQPGLLKALDHDFTPRVHKALGAPESTPLAKVAFQAKRRFWELDDQIYGGISWTDHPITQIWYPTQGIHKPRGILVGAYVFFQGEEFAQLGLNERLELALAGGELLHPQNYRQHLERGVSVSWRKVKYSSGATTHWSDEARKNDYPVLLEADGPYYFAGEYLSYINGWQEGAVRSAHHTITKLSEQTRLRANQKEKKP